MAPSMDSAQVHRACRHLLRHIGDARAFATNPLAAPVVAEFRREKAAAVNRRAANYVRSVLRAVANDLPERQRIILTRCDLERQSHKRVAADLGLSMRQFYRERQALIESLAEILPERLRAHAASTASVVDVSALELARARTLQYGGDPTAATVLLRSIAESFDDPRVATEARAQLASLFVQHNRFADCRVELSAMRSYLAQCRAKPEDLDWCAERIALERRYLLECSGSQHEARRLDEVALPRVERLMQNDDPGSRELAVRAFTAAARREFMSGELQRAKSELESISAIVTAGGIPADARVMSMVLYAIVLATMRTESTVASSLLSDAGAIAVRHGLSELALIAALGRSIDDEMRGAPASALALMHSILPLAKRSASPLNHVHVCLRLADLEAGHGKPQAALLFLDEARAHITYGCYNWIYAELLTGQALLLTGAAADARTHAEQAVAAAAEQQNRRVEGIALRVLAEAHAALNARSAAIAAIEEAVSRLESNGYPLALFHAYRVAAALTGRTRYRRWSVELAQLLRPA